MKDKLQVDITSTENIETSFKDSLIEIGCPTPSCYDCPFDDEKGIDCRGDNTLEVMLKWLLSFEDTWEEK